MTAKRRMIALEKCRKVDRSHAGRRYKKTRISKVFLPAHRRIRVPGAGGAKTFCSTLLISFCPCSVYFETTHVSLEGSVPSSRQAVPSSSHLAADLLRSTSVAYVAAFRSGRSVPASSSLTIYHAVSAIPRPGR